MGICSIKRLRVRVVDKFIIARVEEEDRTVAAWRGLQRTER
jgi:hypothetical protein